MRLRKQLLFLSLVTLILPWAGCQYVQKVDAALRKGQTDALLATAKAVAARLGSDALTVAEVQRYNEPPQSTPVYAHRLPGTPIVDGYNDDWLAFGLDSRPLDWRQKENNSLASVIAGIKGRTLYLFVQVRDEAIQYFNPSQSSLSGSDYVELHLRGTNGNVRDLLLFVSAPGQIQTAYRVQQEESESAPRILIGSAEHRVKGRWLEWGQGYQLELSLPFAWAELGVGLGIGDSKTARIVATNLNEDMQIPPLISANAALENALEVFTRPGVRLQLATASAQMIGSHGDTEYRSEIREQHGLALWLYKIALAEIRKPDIDAPLLSGQFTTPEVTLSLGGKANLGWYQQGAQQIARVSAPIFDRSNDEADPMPIGAVVAEQSGDSLASVTNNAFNQLLVYSLAASSAAGLSLLLYATWLSLRIRKLSAAAAEAISDSGKVTEDFPTFRSRDEVGELSRSYAQLLTRLREYTNYLRTLSSKLSHELRTPLAIVRSSLDNLEHEVLPSQAKVYAERAREGTSRLSNILNAMSAASRVEQAIGAAELEDIPCDRLLSDLKAAYEDVYHHVTFKLNIRHDDGPTNVLGSGELLVQLLDKLVDNAADFCPTEGLIELGLYRQGNWVIFTVRNEGPPLPSHMQSQLFDSMVSVRGKPAPEQEGHHLGLGLYIVRLIADFHRGEVQGYNVPDNSGVIFEVRLPAND